MYIPVHIYFIVFLYEHSKHISTYIYCVCVCVLSSTFNNNISVISWPTALLVEETGVTGENHQPAGSH